MLERIVTLTSAPGWGARPFTVDVVDPRCDGTGLHDPDQPDYLLLNTVCCQVSAFPEESTVGTAVGERGPNLYEWVRERDLRLAADGFTLGTTGRRVRPDDYLPRRILGTYLSWFLQRILARVPGHLTVRFHRAEAVGLASPDSGMRQVTLDDGTVLSAPSVFLTTGHTLAAAAPGRARGAPQDPGRLPSGAPVRRDTRRADRRPRGHGPVRDGRPGRPDPRPRRPPRHGRRAPSLSAQRRGAPHRAVLAHRAALQGPAQGGRPGQRPVRPAGADPAACGCVTGPRPPARA
ncbi:hypothetical protein GCM10020000_00590 [Streptomyces olivoverticillatus]